MGLIVNDIVFENFRNYREFEMKGIGPLTIFVGPNAVGKTNIVEGIQLVTSLSSLKNATVSQLIRWDESYSRIKANLKDENRYLAVELLMEEGKKAYSLNGKPKRPKDLRGVLPAVLFCPDDLSLVKGPQSVKRTTLDLLGVQLSENYHVIKRDYEKIVQHKNSLLKEDFSGEVLQSINETLIAVGARYYCYRNALFKKILPLVKSHYKTIVEKRESLDIAYIPSWEGSGCDRYVPFDYDKEDVSHLLRASIEKRASEERQRRHALVGPHVDRIEFFINGKNASLYGSQGQQRSLVLSYKLAEVSVIQDMTSQKPILLLDDVMSELDNRRREALLTFINGDIQTFVTATHLDYFTEEIKDQAAVIVLGKEESRSVPRGGI